jgi:hypothetical protein
MQDTSQKTVDYGSTETGKSIEYSMTHTSDKQEFVHFKIEMGVIHVENQGIVAALEAALEKVFKIAEHEIIECFKNELH